MDIVDKLAEFDAKTSVELIAEYELKKGHARELALEKPALSALADRIGPLQKTPFDFRMTLLHKPLLKTNSFKIMGNVSTGNPALVATRQTKENFCAFAIGAPCGHKLTSGYDRVSVFPMSVLPSQADSRTHPNIATDFSSRIQQLVGLTWDDCIGTPKQGAFRGIVAPVPTQQALFEERKERGDLKTSFGPRDLFDWIYAVLHSPAYRARYADYLKSDFARIPLPKDRAIFKALVPYGTMLVALHLLDTKVAPGLLDPKSVRLAGSGDNRVTGKSADFENDAWAGGRMYISTSQWFETVPERVANFHIGGYRPARKWLKDRTASGGKRPSVGRVLTPEDILHYRRIIVAMDKTIDIMALIDTEIEKHGGWPDAFRGMTD